MSCYIGEKLIKRSVTSVILQTYSNWELIFWDNNSSDNSRQIINEFNDERIKYFKSDNTTVLGISRGKAIEKSNGEIITFLDVDDIWIEKKLEFVIETFDKKPNSCLYFSNYFIENGEKNFLQTKNTFSVNEYSNLNETIFYNYIRSTGLVAFVTVAIKKKFLNNLDYVFDKNLHIAADFELILRLSEKFQFIFDDRITATYCIHENNETLNSLEKQNNELNYCYEKLKKTNNYNFKLLNLFKDHIEYNYRKIDIENKRFLIFFRKFLNINSNYFKLKLIIIFIMKFVNLR